MTSLRKKILGYERNETVKFHSLESSMKEAVSTFQSVVEADKQNGGPHQKTPLAEN